MESITARDSSVMDDLERGILQALQIDPRAGFSKIAEVLGVSEQTVARRYRRLRGEGLLRIVGLVDPRSVGQSEWMVRVGCRPGGVGRLAEALARRDDVSWVTLTAGGSEIVCSVRSRTAEQRDELLLQRLPATSQVLSMEAYAVLHRFAGGSSTDWTGYGPALRPDQIKALEAGRTVPFPGSGPDGADPGGAGPDEAGAGGAGAGGAGAGGAGSDGAGSDRAGSDGPVTLRPEDGPLLDELAVDGRASYAALAAAAGTTVGRVTRRLEALCRAGVLYFDLDVASGLMGFTAPAYLWLTIEPASLAAAGEQLAGHPEIAFAAAVSGSANLAASILCRDLEDLYQYVTTKISTVAGLRQLAISPVLRRTKQAGSQMVGQRLATPSPPARTRRPAGSAPAT
jgi:DNA-binding Lrp family transcriptional regulator